MRKILTQRAVETAKPKDKRYSVADGLVPGHNMFVQVSGNKDFHLLPRLHGRQLNLKTGDASVVSLADARKEARRLLALIAQGIDPRETKAPPPTAELLAVAARRFIERHVKRTRSSYETERLLEHDVIPVLGTRPIDRIDRAEIVAMLDRIVDRDAPYIANRVLATTRRLLSWLVERGQLTVNPALGIRKPAPETARDRTLSDDELRLVLRAAAGLGHYGVLVLLLLHLGARRDEIAGMCWSEFDADLTTWVLPKERSKNGRALTLPIVPVVRDILIGLPRIADSDFVLSLTGRPIGGFSRNKQRLDAAVTRLNNGQSLRPWVLHDLRRSTASGMARMGVPVHVVEAVLNHRSGTISGIAAVYNTFDYAPEQAQALTAWSAHVLDLTGNRGVQS